MYCQGWVALPLVGACLAVEGCKAAAAGPTQPTNNYQVGVLVDPITCGAYGCGGKIAPRDPVSHYRDVGTPGALPRDPVMEIPRDPIEWRSPEIP